MSETTLAFLILCFYVLTFSAGAYYGQTGQKVPFKMTVCLGLPSFILTVWLCLSVLF